MKHVPYYMLGDDEEEPRYVGGLEEMPAATLREMVLNLLNGYPIFEDVEIEFEKSGAKLQPRQDVDELEEWIDSRNVARFLGKTTGALRKMRQQGKGPGPWKRTSRTSVHYLKSGVIAYQQRFANRGCKSRTD